MTKEQFDEAKDIEVSICDTIRKVINTKEFQDKYNLLKNLNK